MNVGVSSLVNWSNRSETFEESHYLQQYFEAMPLEPCCLGGAFSGMIRCSV